MNRSDRRRRRAPTDVRGPLAPAGLPTLVVGLLTLPPPNPPDHGNCYEDNTFTSSFSFFFAAPPPCP
jgi:hypothetical protein